MMKSKYKNALEALSKHAVFSSVEGNRAGIPSRMLAYFCSKGQIERIDRGIYKIKHVDFHHDFEWEDLAITALSIPSGVICLISALCYYGLTDEIILETAVGLSKEMQDFDSESVAEGTDHSQMVKAVLEQSDCGSKGCVYLPDPIAVSRIMREFWIAVPHSTTSPSRDNTHIVRMRNISLGQTTVNIGSQKVRIFDRERTIVDAFRYLDQETALKALQAYLKAKTIKPDIDKLLKYAKKLRVKLTHYIAAFTLS